MTKAKIEKKSTAIQRANALGLKGDLLTTEDVRIALGYKNIRQVYTAIDPKKYGLNRKVKLVAHNICVTESEKQEYVIFKKDLDAYIKARRKSL